MNAVTNESYPLNLLDKIAGGQWEHPIPEDLEQSLAYVLAGLSEREQSVIRAYFSEEKTYAEIARCKNVTQERIRQILEKSMRKLRHPERIRFLIHGVKGVIHQTSVDSAQNAISTRLERALSSISEISHRLSAITGKEEYSELSETCEGFNVSIPLDELNLSVRGYNCLKRTGMKTVSDITKLTKNELMRVRNLGKKSFEEVVDMVHKLGLKLADEELPEKGM